MKKHMEERPDEYTPDGTTFKLEDVRPGQEWSHYRPGIYTTVGIATNSTNGPDEGTLYVVYTNEAGTLKVRKATEFLDGRFRPNDP